MSLITAYAAQHQRTAAARRAAVRATLAPSVHNTQPWRFALNGRGVELYADPRRRLTILDPSGRQMTISCGCALFTLRTSLAAAAFEVDVDRRADPSEENRIARVEVVGAREGALDPIAALDPLIELRHTNRRRFSDDEVPAEVVDDLVAAAAAEGARLHVVHGEDERISLAGLCQRADAEQNLDPAYRAELRRWTTDDPMRTDGVPSEAVPRVDGAAADEIPIRDFDTYGAGWLPARTESSRRQCLLVLGTAGDSRDQWIRAGEALQRVLLEVTRCGFVASPLTQVVEVASTRAALRSELRLDMAPHVLIRVGRAPGTPATRRRRLVDVLVEKPSPPMALRS